MFSLLTIDRKYFNLTRKAYDEIDILLVGGEQRDSTGTSNDLKLHKKKNLGGFRPNYA